MAASLARGTKTKLYREALRELGADVSFDAFKAFMKKQHGISDVANSAFYRLRADLKTEQEGPVNRIAALAAPSSNGVHAAAGKSAGTTVPSVPVADLPSLLSQARGLIERLGGDRAAAIALIQAL